jgi:hypothetical protein
LGRSTAMAMLSTQWLTSCEAMVAAWTSGVDGGSLLGTGSSLAIRPREGRVAYADGRVAGGSSMVDLWYGNNH